MQDVLRGMGLLRGLNSSDCNEALKVVDTAGASMGEVDILSCIQRAQNKNSYNFKHLRTRIKFFFLLPLAGTDTHV